MWEVLLIFLVVLLLFGAKRLPEIGSSLGKGIREFKGSLREIEDELKVDDDRPSSNQGTKRPSTEDEAAPGPRRLTGSDIRPPAAAEQEPREKTSEPASSPDESS